MSSPMAGDGRDDVDDLALIEAHAKRTSCGVYFAVCLFGMAASLGHNALWIMVPVSGKQLPEDARIPQYLVGLLELGNISAITFVLTRRCSRRGAVTEAPAIYFSIVVSIAAMALLALFWEQQYIVSYGSYSLVYLAAAFGICQVTCLSAMTYIPFVSRLKATYITALLLGEALATLIPHKLAIGEGISLPPPCPDKGENRSFTMSGWRTRFLSTTTIKPATPPPLLFNVSIYFYVMTGLLCLSGFCFLILRCIPSIRFEYDQIQVDTMDGVELGDSGGRGQNIEDDIDNAWNAGNGNTTVDGARAVILDDGSIKQPFARVHTQSQATHSPAGTPKKHQSKQIRIRAPASPAALTVTEAKSGESCMDLAPSFCLLMLITFWTSLFLFGPLSSVKAHGCLPIGNKAFFAGTILTALTPIVVIIISLLVNSDSKVTLVVAFTSLGTILLTYFVALIAFSHESESKEESPIFGNKGELLTVS